jgi:putative DNA-invertase from lambdoid prophage Rac
MAVFGYCRVSTSRQADDGLSLEVQRRQIRGYCEMHGLVLTELVTEEGVSGSVPVSERPAGAVFFGRLRSGDMVIASKLDRLFRSALDALQVVEDLKGRGVKLHLLDLGGDIAANGLSKLFLTVAAAFAEAERDRIRERVAQVKANQRTQGRFLGGSLPFGYASIDGTLVPLPDEQEAITKMRRMKAEGMSLRAIAVTLKASGHSLSHTAVARVLRDNA